MLRVTLLCILCSPPVYQKLKNTVKNAVETGAASDPISFSQAKGLPYLAVCTGSKYVNRSRGE